MPVWTFYDFIDALGTNHFHDWQRRLAWDAQAHIDNRILAMERMRKWPEKWFSSYGDNGLFELRISFNRVQYRPLAVYHPTIRMSLVLLRGAIEKGGKLPKGDVAAAEGNRDTLLGSPGNIRRHQFNP